MPLFLLSAACTPGQVDFDTGKVPDDSATETGDTDSAETGDSGESGDSGDSRDSGDSGDSGETGDTDPGPYTPCESWAEPVATGVVADGDLNELSGIVASRKNPGVFWVHEDHLGGADVYALDAKGVTVLTVHLQDATNNDWEDIALAPCDGDWCLWVGEIGNNDFDREGLGVYRFVEPDLSTLVEDELDVVWTFFGYTYPEAAENSEAMVIDADGMPVLFTKRYDTGTSGVYRYPSLVEGEEVALEFMADVSTVAETDTGEPGGEAAATAADLRPDGARVLLRTYGDQFELDLDGWATLGASPRLDLTPPDEPHGEAIAYDAVTGGIWQVAEGDNPRIWYTPCADQPE